MTIRIGVWRWLAKILQAAGVLGIPFLRINGESVLRFDVPALTLHVFGTRLAMDEFFLVLVAVLLLSFLVAVLTVLFGRIWCGWVCPQTVITDFTGFVDAGLRRGKLSYAGSILLLVPISLLLGASVIWYFVSPYEFFDRLRTHTLGPVVWTLWISTTLITFANLSFIRRSFCATICPYAKMQGMLFDEQTLIIAMDPERRNECMGCDACVRACPVGIDVRKGLQSACVNCAECIDACADKMNRKMRGSLIGYRYGLSGGRFVPWRKGVVLSSAGLAAFMVLFTILVVSRPSVEMVIVPDTRSEPAITSEGDLLNMFTITLTNRTGSDQKLMIQAVNSFVRATTVPGNVQVRKNDRVRISIVVKVPGSDLRNNLPIKIPVKVVSMTDPLVSVTQTINLQYPPDNL
ncbi:MAG: 4Fe-4S binding protein [Nitrospirota bacterium]|nr:4Fe-4S binding protein [Nitrospirota bacterium]